MRYSVTITSLSSYIEKNTLKENWVLNGSKEFFRQEKYTIPWTQIISRILESHFCLEFLFIKSEQKYLRIIWK